MGRPSECGSGSARNAVFMSVLADAAGTRVGLGYNRGISPVPADGRGGLIDRHLNPNE